MLTRLVSRTTPALSRSFGTQQTKRLLMPTTRAAQATTTHSCLPALAKRAHKTVSPPHSSSRNYTQSPQPRAPVSRSPAVSSYAPSAASAALASDLAVPNYLNEVYWWAYVHPNAVRFFERQWLVNLILWGNFCHLRDLAIKDLSSSVSGSIEGNTLQIACVYGDLTPIMARKLAQNARLDIVDVVPAQLANLQKKLEENGCASDSVGLLHRDATNLAGVADHSYDQVLLFFLLHEMPEATRAKTLSEAVRVVKPGGKIVIVDYHQPHGWNPYRMIMYPVLKYLEPYALDLWRNEVSTWLPADMKAKSSQKDLFFGGLYQKIVINM